jgi:hypothetical protein
VIGAIGDGATSGRLVNNVDVQEYGYSFVTGSKSANINRQISLASNELKLVFSFFFIF